MAEVIRGGLQAIPKGQYEAAEALGLGYWQGMGLIVLPQALSSSFPGIVNTFIAFFKDTSLVLDHRPVRLLHRPAPRRRSDANWIGLATEGYVFAAVVYFGSSASRMSRYSLSVERKLDTGHTALKGHERWQPTAATRTASCSADVHKWYGEFHVLQATSTSTCGKGEQIVVCGPSGSGKSTLIRCINRLEEHQQRPDRRRRHRAHQRPEERRRDPPRGRHGVPALQPVSAPDGAGEPDPGADLGAQACRKTEAEGDGHAATWSGCASPSRPTSIPGSSPAASSSASRSRARCA